MFLVPCISFRPLVSSRISTFSCSLAPFLVSLVFFSAYSTVFLIAFLQYNLQFFISGPTPAVFHFNPLLQRFSLAVTMCVSQSSICCSFVVCLCQIFFFATCNFFCPVFCFLFFLPFLVSTQVSFHVFYLCIHVCTRV